MKIKKIEENCILFDNGCKLQDYHHQDCCEEVYADFDVIKTYNVSPKTGKIIDIKDIDFEESLLKLIQGVKGAGVNLVSKKKEKFFIPCYNSQNGYYSSDLELELFDEYGNLLERVDISDFVKDEIY